LKTNEKSIENLKWVRIFDPVHIPKEYIDQIKHKEFTCEKFYEFISDIALISKEDGFVINPYNLLFVLVDDNNRTKGVLWMVIDNLANALVINTFSIDKEYWGNGSAVNFLKEKAIEIKEKENLSKIYWITRSPKHSEKFGFKRSKNTLMEYTDGKLSERTDIRTGCQTDGPSESNDTRTREVAEGCTG